MALSIAEQHMDEGFRRSQMEQELKHKHELYEMYQTCKDELHSVRHRTLLEASASPSAHYQSPRLYALDGPLAKLNELVLEKELSPSHQRLSSPYHRAYSPRGY